MPSPSMTSQSQSNNNNNGGRRDGSRNPNPNPNPNPNSRLPRQEWIPRGFPSTPPPLPAFTSPSPSPSASSTNSDFNTGGGAAGVSTESRAKGGNMNRRNSRFPNSSNWSGSGGDHILPNPVNNTAPLDTRLKRNFEPFSSRRKEGDAAKSSVAPFFSRRKDGDAGKSSVPPKDPSVPQLVQELQEKLAKGDIECMICYDMVRRTAPVWSCSSCFSIFHLNCIKKWARAPTSADLPTTEKSHGINWRCPGCQSVQLCPSKEIRYTCFCGKRHDPPFDLYLTPHSCGEPCGKPLDKSVGDEEDGDVRCPHACVLQCHPGPCPPCKAFAPPSWCPCGKKMITTRCFDRKSVLTCGDQCDKFLECGRHRCEKTCHTGPCEPCLVPMNAVCFCKKESQNIICGEMSVKGEISSNNGVFSCSSVCGRELDCGHHACAQVCHPGPCGDCELMPSRVKTCCCGKTELLKERNSCLDPIPTCSQTCDKLLPCNIHRCKDVCHVGDCAPCMNIVSQSCRCGSSSRRAECFKTMGETFLCEKPCGKKKNCGRHRCSDRCCPLFNSKNQFSGDWDPHLCSMVCGKKLRCGQHSCQSLCHLGHCPPCLETIFTDLSCACGKTTIPPPQPCGTLPPLCQHPCLVPQSCGHPSSHGCHFGDCPPCSVPVLKECVGGHVLLRNIPCGSKDIRCNQLCGKTRVCGMHACARTCHPLPCDPFVPGNSSGSKSSCGQTCGAPRRDCRHTCTAPCHPSAPCPDSRCEFSVTITCSCGRITAKVPCDAGGSSGGFRVDTIFEASVMQKLPAPLQPIEESGKKVPLGQRKLVCDEECARVERKRVLADAFDISTPNLDALHLGESSTLPDVLADMFRRDPKWVLCIEERFRSLVLGKGKGGGANGMRVHVFCPMLKEKRDAVRQIAERWKLGVHAAGWEPKRFLTVHVTPKSKVPPRMLAPKGAIPLSVSHALAFDPLVDMDPRLVVSLFDLPSDSDISALVLRFGGECELVWLNDKNALAVFSDPVRAATALRRLDHGSVYHGVASGTSAATPGVNVWGGAKTSNAWKKAVVQDSRWEDDAWEGEDWSSGANNVHGQVWKGNEPPLAPNANRWKALEPDSTAPKSVAMALSGTENTVKVAAGSSSGTVTEKLSGGDGGGVEPAEVVDDWEKAFD